MMDISPYFSVPYVEGGKSDDGADCWHLVMMVRRELGLPDLPPLHGVSVKTPLRMIREYRSLSQVLEQCDQPADGVIAAVFKASAFVHVGVCVAVDGRMGVLETNQATGPRWMPIRRFLDTYYRVLFYRDIDLSQCP